MIMARGHGVKSGENPEAFTTSPEKPPWMREELEKRECNNLANLRHGQRGARARF